ncbi:MAG: hypothetical protein V4539_01255 [Bacteroidota bacterium]
MKKIIYSMLIMAAVAGCKKNADVSLSPVASLNFVNASVNVGTAKAVFTGVGGTNFYSAATAVAYGANTVYGVTANISVPMTVVNYADTTKAIASANLNLTNAGIYSLFLAGQSNAVDTIMVKENLPTYTDSVCGVRFINLSYNSNPITITLSTSTTVEEFSGLSYKNYSAFKSYPSLAATPNYTFQVKDATTKAVLGTYAFTPYRFFNVTLAWIGQTGATGTNAPKVIRVNNY